VNGAFFRAARVTTATGMSPAADPSGPSLSYSPSPVSRERPPPRGPTATPAGCPADVGPG